jgi:hypothetical protein
LKGIQDKMFGDDISLLDLVALLKGIRDKNLILQVKIGEEAWQVISKDVVTKMLSTVVSGKVSHTNDIRLRLFA